MSWKLREYSLYHQNGFKVSLSFCGVHKKIVIWFFPQDSGDEIILEIGKMQDFCKKKSFWNFHIFAISRAMPGDKAITENFESNSITFLNDYDGTLTNIFNVVFYKNSIDSSRIIIQKSVFLLSKNFNVQKEFRSQNQKWDFDKIMEELYYELKRKRISITK
ncbi:hypothetical protein SSABA_v1c02000 [Spiroplasma sabaudiense Ar-1343]|uniref:Uncharacterized protein n=1 Tax=Spiroplasma sabaudiense Ar-1343 TaxID=1276257 RepID=W6A9A9_9MOLU|nr:hypothetical protein [Spiroplasma sabaudiense]AHI53612.1 hypothetical protein SSABA_v1c02000 [Spiroplasma sabaudiense Ar-1343]